MSSTLPRHPEVRAPQASLRSLRMLGCVRASKGDGIDLGSTRDRHLKETKSHATQVSRRIKQLGGNPETVSLPGPEGLSKAAESVSDVVGKAKAAAQGPPPGTHRRRPGPDDLLEKAFGRQDEDGEENDERQARRQPRQRRCRSNCPR